MIVLSNVKKILGLFMSLFSVCSPHYSLANKVIWITGASSGIGEALAHELAIHGAILILSARQLDKLNQIKADLQQYTEVMVLPLDVSNKASYPEVIARIDDCFGKLDMVVLNAGINREIFIDDGCLDSTPFVEVINTNFLAAVYGIEAALPLLHKAQRPLIAATASLAAYAGMPWGEAYDASKAALRTMLQSLRVDLIPYGIDVSVICPGFVKTPMVKDYFFPMPFLMSSTKAAQIITKGLQRHQQEIHFPLRLSLTLKFLAMLPTPLYTWIVNKAKPCRSITKLSQGPNVDS